jgi:RNA polymerase sigma-70 factor, ECF subfamily
VAPGSISSAGDAAALFSSRHTLDVATVFREQGPYVHRILRRLGVQPSDVDDAFQEVFVVVHRKLAEFEHRSSVRGWVYGICVRIAARYRRLRAVAREVAEEEAAEPIDPVTPIECVSAKQAREVLGAILDQLDDEKREVFVLYELEELTMSEIAQLLDCPLPTAYSRLHTAREAVRAAVHRYRARREFK